MVSEDWIEKSHDSWSVFKIMGELVEGYEKLSQLGPCVSIFGSARTKPDDKYYKKTIIKLNYLGHGWLAHRVHGALGRQSRQPIRTVEIWSNSFIIHTRSSNLVAATIAAAQW